jgi:hypothetical protein
MYHADTLTKLRQNECDAGESLFRIRREKPSSVEHAAARRRYQRALKSLVIYLSNEEIFASDRVVADKLAVSTI